MAGRPHLVKRGELAAITRHHPDDAQRIEAARAELRDANAEWHIREIVDQAPPLSAETRARLAVLLLSGGDAA
jgi:hypothetical protein